MRHWIKINKLFNEGWFEGRVADINHDLGEKSRHCVYSDGDSEYLSIEELEQLLHYERRAIDENKKKIQYLEQRLQEKDESSKLSKGRTNNYGKVSSLPFLPVLTQEHIKLADILRKKKFLQSPSLNLPPLRKNFTGHLFALRGEKMDFSFKLDPIMQSFQYEDDVSVGFEWKCVKSLDDDQAIFDHVLSTNYSFVQQKRI